MDFDKLSIKHFISDLPRILNKNFDTIKVFMNKLFTETESGITIGSSDISLKGKFTYIYVRDIDAANIVILKQNGERVDLETYVQDIVRTTVEEMISSS